MKQYLIMVMLSVCTFSVHAQSVTCGWEKNVVLALPIYITDENGQLTIDEYLPEPEIPQSSNPNYVTSGGNGFDCGCLASMSDEAALQIAKVDPSMFSAVLACKQ